MIDRFIEYLRYQAHTQPCRPPNGTLFPKRIPSPLPICFRESTDCCFFFLRGTVISSPSSRSVVIVTFESGLNISRRLSALINETINPSANTIPISNISSPNRKADHHRGKHRSTRPRPDRAPFRFSFFGLQTVPNFSEVYAIPALKRCRDNPRDTSGDQSQNGCAKRQKSSAGKGSANRWPPSAVNAVPSGINVSGQSQRRP